jgi:class 3 adenylate cyclase
MTDIPTGIVTFLFTDIEGSTRLAQEYPEELTEALGIHHKILSSAIENNEGFVFEIIGDAFCSVFHDPADAVVAARDIQKNLSGMNGPVNVKVRIGINTGEAFWNGTKFNGYITLARTQRIMSAAHGGQILISDISKHQHQEKLLKEFHSVIWVKEDSKILLSQ